MRGKLLFVPVLLLAISCSRDGIGPWQDLDYEYGRDIPHGMIELGDRLENPYTTENMTKALQSLYPTKADRVEVRTTNLYVRFLPENESEFEKLKGLTSDLMDHPLDYDIRVEGDWYHDPEIDEGEVTWQYAVVPPDFRFPHGMRYEVIDECYIAENDPGTKSDGIDWEAVEAEAYRLTGNMDMIMPQPTKAPSKSQPSGRMTIIDEDYCDGKPVGIAGVRVSCNTFVKFDHAVTDRDGYYQMKKTFSSQPRYRLVFKNEKGFSIGLNMVLVPASVSTLGKSGPEGVDMTVTKDSDDKLFRRSVVNNAVYDYITRCAEDDMDLPVPPADLRLWIFNSLESGSSVMMHHGTFVDSELVSNFLGKFAPLLSYFLPDITIGTKYLNDFKTIYSSTCHELAHATHFSRVGIEYWNSYITYVMESFIKTGGDMYGDGKSDDSGYCEIGEMWAYYMESKMFRERYGGSFPTFGAGYWFYPQIFSFLDERGLKAADIFSVLDADITSRADLKIALTSAFPERRTAIEQVFSRY